MDLIKEISDKLGIPLLLLCFALLFYLEGKLQLRKRVQSRWKRAFINAIVAIPSFVLLRWLFLPVIVWLAAKNELWHIGLNYMYSLPAWMEAIIAFLLLDYSNYVWHVLLHKLPFLWRFHLVHHTDLDLDVTTAFRFHFGELITSVVFRGGAGILTGTSPEMVIVYEIIYEAAVQFHHSNWKLPFRLESILNKVIVTPRMHGIHHSVIRRETDTNYSIIFSFWDRLHKTIKLNILQHHIVVGVPAYSNKKELTIGYLLRLPFTRIRKWHDAPVRNDSDDITDLRP